MVAFAFIWAVLKRHEISRRCISLWIKTGPQRPLLMAASTTHFLALSTAHHSETNIIVVLVIISSITD